MTNAPRPKSSRLIDVDHSVLIVIDVQKGFLKMLEKERRRPLVEKAAWLIEAAKLLHVPIVATAEDAEHLGPVVKALQSRLPKETPILDKKVFGLADDDLVMPKVEALGRKTAVLVGVETDVCITHSALGLLNRGYRVAIVADAVQSPGDAHSQGLARMRDTGVIMTSTKGVFYEWTRTVAKAKTVSAALASTVPLPSGIVL